MSAPTTIPTRVTPEAAERVAELGIQAEVEQMLEQPEVSVEVPVDQEKPLHALACLLAEVLGLVLVAQDLAHQPAKGHEVARVAQQQLKSDLAQIEQYNGRVEEVNGRVVAVLRTVTGQEFDEPGRYDPWRAWWTGSPSGSARAR